MSDAVSHLMEELPFPLDQGPDVMLTKNPPTCPGDSQGTVRRSVSLSSYGVEEMMEEDRQRYERSASLSPTEFKKIRRHPPSPNEPSIYPEVPPFRLPSERQIDQKDQIEEKSTGARKRKRSPTPVSDTPASTTSVSNALVPSTPQNSEPEGCSKFHGVILHRKAGEALDFAWRMEDCKMRTDRTHRHIFWTDASIVFGACAAGAVVWKQPPSWAWKTQGFPYPCLTQSTDVVEMFAIAQALKRAIDDVKQSLGDSMNGLDIPITQRVFVFTDSIAALNNVKKGAQSDPVRPASEQARTIIGYSVDLHNLGAKVELHLVPGHNGVPGNTRAHRAAYEAAKHAAAEAGITSTEQGFAMHQNQESLAMVAPTAPRSVSAGSSKKSRKRSSLLSQPLLWKKLRDKTPPKLISPLDQTDSESEELVNMKGKIFMSMPGPHSVRPDRAPVLGPSFTSVNAGSHSSTGFTPINASWASSTGSSAKISSSRVRWSALNPWRWFMPVDAKSTLRVASSSQSLSASMQKPALHKKQKTGNVIGDFSKSPDNAESSLGHGQFLFPSENNVPAAVLDSSAVSKSCSGKPKPARTSGSMLSAASFFHRFRLKNSGNAVFGETALSSFIPQGNQPAAKTIALAKVSFCLDSPVPTTNAVLVPAFNQASFPAMKPFDSFSPRPQSSHSPNPRGDAALLQRQSILETPKTSPLFVTTSKMRSFAYPGEPKDGITLAPLSSFYDDKIKQRKDTALAPASPLSSDAPKPPSSKFTISNMELFASPRESGDGMRVAPLSSFYDDKSKECEDRALPPLPPSALEVPKPGFSFATTSKMRSFASPGVPWNESALAQVSPSNEETAKPRMSTVSGWPLFTQSRMISPDVAKFRAESPSDDSSSASTPASEPFSSPYVTPIAEGVNPPATMDLAPAVPLNPSTGVYTPRPFHRPPGVYPIITAIDTLIYQVHPDPNMLRIDGLERPPWSKGPTRADRE